MVYAGKLVPKDIAPKKDKPIAPSKLNHADTLILKFRYIKTTELTASQNISQGNNIMFVLPKIKV